MYEIFFQLWSKFIRDSSGFLVLDKSPAVCLLLGKTFAFVGDQSSSQMAIRSW